MSETTLMKKKGKLVCLLELGIIILLLTPNFVGNIRGIEPVHMPAPSTWGLSRFPHEEVYVYTTCDIVVFSYADDATFTIRGAPGTIIWGSTLNYGEHHIVTNLAAGIYNIVGDKKFSVLIGDPISTSCMSYYARNGDGFGLSTTLYTYMPKRYATSAQFIVFAYTDGTAGKITNTDTGAILNFGPLDKGQHYSTTAMSDTSSGHFVKVESNYPVSALSYGNDQGYFAPSVSGKFSGTEFYTYSYYNIVHGQLTKNTLHVMAYEDGTTVTIKDSVSGTVYDTVIMGAGGRYALSSLDERYYTILSDKDVTVGVLPRLTDPGWAQGTYVPDRSGVGIGTEFYSFAYSSSVHEREYLRIIAYHDDTTIDVYDAPFATQKVTYHLDQGDVEKIAGCGYWHIISDKNISVFSEGEPVALGSFAPIPYPTTEGSSLSYKDLLLPIPLPCDLP